MATLILEDDHVRHRDSGSLYVSKKCSSSRSQGDAKGSRVVSEELGRGQQSNLRFKTGTGSKQPYLGDVVDFELSAWLKPTLIGRHHLGNRDRTIHQVIDQSR